MRERGFGGGLDLAAARALGAIGDIGGDGVGEQRGLLRHEREARAERREIGLVDGDAVDLDLAGVGIVEAEQEREDRGLAGARWADKGDPLARLDGEAHPIERARLRPQRIGEGDIGEGDLAPRRGGQRLRMRRRFDLRLDLQQLAQALGRAGRLADLAPYLAELADGASGKQRIEHELPEPAAGHGP